ncbi:MAG: trypsin-like peptidase domain-containing protein [Anaerolineae bacterium]|nr:trypsin-like peptidase domain-containing protein [Anaerolineae bacterium]
MNKKIVVHHTLAIPLLLGLAGCSAVALPIQSALSSQAAPIVITNEGKTSSMAEIGAPAITKNDTMTALETELEQIYSQVGPSVVSIQVSQKTNLAGASNSPFSFGRPFIFPDNPQSPNAPQEFYQHGAGSGFVWDKDGHIVTNNHVVNGADKITVTLADETVVPAEVVGTDPDSDLAVIKIDVPAAQLQPVTLSDSTKVKVGQLAVAIGNPFGLENTMTVGFVSALGRVLPVTSGESLAVSEPGFTIPDIIQTDASINPGNSGGVLVDDQGQVIGVTAAIESPARVSAGVGFAIPSAVVDKVVPALIESGHFEHSWLGLSGITLFPELADAMNLDTAQHGALVIQVTPDSPAAKAGLHGSDRQITIEDQQVLAGGDVITAIDGQPVTHFDDLVSYLAGSTTVGQKVELTILRQGKEETVSATLAGRPQPTEAPAQVTTPVKQGPSLGVEGIDMTPEIAKAMDLPTNQQGVLIEQIVLNSPADNADLNGSYMAVPINGHSTQIGGDVIVAVDDQPITGLADLRTYLGSRKPGQEITLTVMRDGKKVDVPVQLEDLAAKP